MTVKTGRCFVTDAHTDPGGFVKLSQYFWYFKPLSKHLPRLLYPCPANRQLGSEKPYIVGTAVSCNTQMKASGKQLFLSFRSYYPLYGYNYKSQKVYFYK